MPCATHSFEGLMRLFDALQERGNRGKLRVSPSHTVQYLCILPRSSLPHSPMTSNIQGTSFEAAATPSPTVTIDTIDTSLNNPVLGRVVISRASGVPVQADLRAGDTVDISIMTEVWQVAKEIDGSESVTFETCMKKEWAMEIAWPSNAPDGDTIRVRSWRGKTSGGRCREPFPHPPRTIRLGPKEDISRVMPDRTRSSHFAPTDGCWELRPDKLSMSLKPATGPTRNWPISPEDEIWVERAGDKVKFPLEWYNEYMISGDEGDEGNMVECSLGN